MTASPNLATNRGWPFIYFILTIVLHAIIVGFIFNASISNGFSIDLFRFFYTVIIGLPITERLTQTILFIIARSPSTPPRLNQLMTSPRVALLYCSCDDVVQECLESLNSQEYHNLSIFILDDSRTDQYKKLIDDSGHMVIRRSQRNGYKAGNINNWLKIWGQEFDYFVIVDADSILPPDFVGEMLLYAEHPDNSKIALFESRIQAWRPRSLLQKAIGIQLFMASEESIRLSNRLGITLSNGHNNLCRAWQLLYIGGFDEKYVGEDHATALNLLACGIGCRLVNVESYEVMPINLLAINKRSYRWVRNDLQLMFHPWAGTPLILQYKLVLKSLIHCLWIIIAFYMVALIWSQQSTFPDLANLLFLLFDSTKRPSSQLISVLMIFLLYSIYLYFLSIPHVVSLRLNFFRYLFCTFIGLCIGFGDMFAVLLGIAHSITGTPFHFQVTPKKASKETFLSFVYAHWAFCTFAFISMFGVLHNPVSLVFNWPWVLPLVISPLVLYIVQQSRSH